MTMITASPRSDETNAKYQRISIVVPTCGRPRMLRRALASVAAQSFRDFDCTIVNDKFEDRNAVDQVLEELNDQRFVVHHNESQLGGCRSRNLGIEKTKSDVVAFLDDDDAWDDEKLSIHLQAHNAAGHPDVAYSDIFIVWDDDLLPPKYMSGKQPPSDPAKAILAGQFGPLTSTAFSVLKSSIESIGGFDDTLRSYQDWDLWLRLALDGATFSHCPKALAYFVQHLGIRTSTHSSTRLQGLQQIREKHATLGFSDATYSEFASELFGKTMRSCALRRDLGHWIVNAAKKTMTNSFVPPFGQIMFDGLLMSNRRIARMVYSRKQQSDFESQWNRLKAR